jgi:hypothetical protein
MPEFSHDMVVPAAMPVLSRGKHRNPLRGACFMEYTSLLAGESFTDEPRCVDRELAAVLRGANDKLSDAQRHRLVPFLGRAIGMAVEPPPPGRMWRRPAAERRCRAHWVRRYQEQSTLLRRTASRRFQAAVGSWPSPTTEVWSRRGEDLAWLFWDLMDEPTAVGSTEDYVRRLIDRVHLLHECYEQAMDELGLPRTVQAGAASAGSPRPAGPGPVADQARRPVSPS